MASAPRQQDSSANSYCVVGAGHGGMAMAADLGIRGLDVRVYDRSTPRLDVINAFGGIRASGEVTGFGKVQLATDDIAKATDGCDVVMVATPAMAHGQLAQALAPHLQDGQVVLLNPGRVLGALEFLRGLHLAGCQAKVTVAEALSFTYRSRVVGPGTVQVFQVREAVPVAAIPATVSPSVVDRLQSGFPQFMPALNILQTSFSNVGAALHPVLMLLNVGWIEDHADFELYAQGAPPSVCRILEHVDAERMAVAQRLGIQSLSGTEWQYLGYGVEAPDLYTAIQANRQYEGIPAPRRLDHRYVREDIPTSLVPIASLGDAFGEPTPTIRSLIQVGCCLSGQDYWQTGRTARNLGLQGLSIDQFRALALSGAFPEGWGDGSAEVAPDD